MKTVWSPSGDNREKGLNSIPANWKGIEGYQEDKGIKQRMRRTKKRRGRKKEERRWLVMCFEAGVEKLFRGLRSWISSSKARKLL